MNISTLAPGVYYATHKLTGDVFMLSVSKDRHGVVKGVAPFPVGGKRPSRLSHSLPTGQIALWLAELEVAPAQLP